MDKCSNTPPRPTIDNKSKCGFRPVQTLISTICLLTLFTSLPADAGNRNRLKRPQDNSDPVLQMQTPTAEPTNPGAPFDLRLRKSVAEDGVGEGVLESGTAANTQVPNVTIKLEGGVTQVELQKLAKYDVTVLLDRSHSMTARDCPPYSYDPVKGHNMGIPRWDWCREQTKPLASLTGRTPGQGFTLVTFYSTFSTFRNVTMRQVERIFAEQAPNLEVGTCLNLALQDTLENYFRRRDSSPRGTVNPLALAIVTDGRVRSSDIEQILLNATRRMRDPDEIHVTMLLIGDRGPIKRSAGINYLDDTLQRSGARYNIVSVVPFQVISQMGLSKALIQALP